MTFVFAGDQAAHDKDVKCLCVLPSNPFKQSSDAGLESMVWFLTGSRDHTVKLWCAVSTPQVSMHLLHTYKHHQHYVNAIGFIPASLNDPMNERGWILSAGADKIVYVYPPPERLPVFDTRSKRLIYDVAAELDQSIEDSTTYALIGHDNNISCLCITQGNKIVSGSWDKTLRVWEDWNCVYVLKGHEEAVWSVASLSNGTILSGSADKTIRMWVKDKCVSILKGHTDAVRQICVLPMGGFASCSNDSTVRIWGENGNSIRMLGQEGISHSSYIYTMTTSFGDPMRFNQPHIATAGEDGKILFWREESCIQVLNYPCGSIWALGSASIGDKDNSVGLLIVGGSDGHIRIMASSDRLAACDSDRIKFEEEQARNRKMLGKGSDIDVEKLPGPEALKTQVGSKNGAVLMIKQPSTENNIEESYTIQAYQWDATSNSWTHVGQVMRDGEPESPNTSGQMHEGKMYDYVFKIDLEDRGMLSLPFMKAENPYSAAHLFIQKHELPIGYLDQIANFIMQNTSDKSKNTIQEEPKTNSRDAAQPWVLMRVANKAGIMKKIQEFNKEFISVGADLTDKELELLDNLITELLLDQNTHNNVSVLKNLASEKSKEGELFTSSILKMKKWSSDRIFPFLDCVRLFFLNELTVKICIHQDIFTFLRTSVRSDASTDDSTNTRNASLVSRCLVNTFGTEYGRNYILSSENTGKIMDLYDLIASRGADLQHLEGFKQNFSILSETQSALLSWIHRLA
jgi:WD40 repeat protein